MYSTAQCSAYLHEPVSLSTRSWRETTEGHWTGVMGGRVWTLTQTDDTLWYHVYENHARGDRKMGAGVSLQEGNKSERRFKEEDEGEVVTVTSVQDTKEEEEMLRDYFQLNVELGALYKEWKTADPHFKKVSDIFTGKSQSQFVCAFISLIRML